MSENILLVEDEENLGNTLSEYLDSIGHNVVLASSAKMARDQFIKSNPRIVIMDIGLPDGDGLELGREFRKIRQDFVLIFLTAQNAPESKLQGLEIGAEDYMTKPFLLKELNLRLERILKYNQDAGTLPTEIQIGKLKIFFSRFIILDALNQEMALSQRECELLKCFYQNKNNVVSRELIIDKIWGQDSFPSLRTIDNMVVKLRKWAETDSSAIEIKSIRGVGYMLNIL